MNAMSKTVLVTGAHGFLGRHVARAFANDGATVTGLGHGAWDRSTADHFGLTFWHSADVTLDTLVTYGGKPDVIVHCAGSGSVGFSVEQPHQDFVRTVANTAAVLEYVRLHSPRTVVVYPSSAAVYGNAIRLPIREDSALSPASPYGVHKLMAEELCQSYARHYGVAVAIVRYFSIYGEGLQKQLLWDACAKALRNESAFFGTGEELRDWVHAEDAAALLRTAAMHATPDCPIVNGGSGTGVTVREILTELLAAAGKPSPTFNGTPRPGDPKGYEADIAAATAWGWAPTIPWRDGVRRYATWFASRAR